MAVVSFWMERRFMFSFRLFSKTMEKGNTPFVDSRIIFKLANNEKQREEENLLKFWSNHTVGAPPFYHEGHESRGWRVDRLTLSFTFKTNVIERSRGEPVSSFSQSPLPPRNITNKGNKLQPFFFFFVSLLSISSCGEISLTMALSTSNIRLGRSKRWAF